MLRWIQIWGAVRYSVGSKSEGVTSVSQASITLNGSGTVLVLGTKRGDGSTTYTTSTSGQITVTPSVGSISLYDGLANTRLYTYTDANNATFTIKSPSVSPRCGVIVLDAPNNTIEKLT